jgi:hypothetical protein
MDSGDFFSADVRERFCAGPPTSAAVTRVRDVVVCVTNGTTAAAEEFKAHPPIAGSAAARAYLGAGGVVELGGSIRIDRLEQDEATMVINACTPRGHYFFPVYQFGQRYSFIREIDLEERERDHYNWDPNRVLWNALVLSRLVRDNGYSTQFAARIADYEDGQQSMAYTLESESKHVYRLREDRDWLDAPEGEELGALLAAYWDIEDQLAGRVRRAMWRAEYASWLAWADLVVPVVVSGLESLLNTDPESVTAQFTHRVPALAEAVGVDGVSRGLCKRMYEARSAWIHGSHVRLFASGAERVQQQQSGVQTGPASSKERDVLTQIAVLQGLLRAAVRRCLEDPAFHGIFEESERIRERWPVAVAKA